MHITILPRLACPVCQGALHLAQKGAPPAAEALVWEERLSCESCREAFVIAAGIPRLIRPERRAAAEEFVAGYNRVRLAEGWAVEQADYYKALPYRDSTGRHAAEWQARAYSFGRLVARLTRMSAGRALRVVDLGAGCGWLAARLAEAGHQAIALDLDAGPHGLAAAGHIKSDGPGLACVQGELEAPPLARGQADVVIIGAALHYARAPRETIEAAYRALAPGGALCVLDSPIYETERDRERAAAASARYYRERGEPQLAESYRGLVRGELKGALSAFRDIEVERTHQPPLWRALLRRLFGGYRPARFELIWARRP